MSSSKQPKVAVSVKMLLGSPMNTPGITLSPFGFWNGGPVDVTPFNDHLITSPLTGSQAPPRVGFLLI